MSDAQKSPWILEANQATFQEDVVERSRQVPVVIDFWATWCQPCLDEIPDYNRLFRAYGSKIRFIGVATDSGTEKEVKLAVKELKISYPVAAPTLKELDVFGDILIFPTTWVIDSEGRIVQEFLGVPPGKHEQLRGLVDKLLAQIPKR